MKNSNKKGFTIVELVIVVAVIAILAAVLIPTFSSLVNKANQSADQQAVRQMNTHLAVANVTGEVKSILDVYDIFENSGFTIESYSSLAKDTQFYYDVQLNKILYVDTTSGKVVFPEEHKDETQGTHDWFTLSMTIETVSVESVESEGTEKYSVSSPGEYAFIVEKLNKSYPANTNVVIDLNADLDLQGANIAIETVPEGASITINGNGYTLKNITANTFSQLGEGDDSERKYIAAGLIGNAKGSVSITNLVLENVNVKETNAGNVAIVAGHIAGSGSVISNVTIKNSTVIGHRSVGAVVGMLYDDIAFTNITLENVEVKTIAGRSGLVFGYAAMGGENCTITGLVNTNSTLSIYECDQNMGEGCSIVDYAYAGTYGTNATKVITSYSIESDGSKAFRTYGFNPDALGCTFNPNSIDGTRVDNKDSDYRYCHFMLAE